MLSNSIDRRLVDYAVESKVAPFWLDFYYSDVDRRAGGAYSTQARFSNYNYGMTAGFKLPDMLTPLETVLNIEQSNLNIDGRNQRIESSSMMVGLVAPTIAELLGAKLSLKSFIGYADNNGDRKVYTNISSYEGSRNITSDYDSVYGTFGTALTKSYAITDSFYANVLLGLDLNLQRVGGYKESDYFSWNQRTLTQLQSRLQMGLDYRFGEGKSNVFARFGIENRDLISGAIQDYKIVGQHVSFNTNNRSDTYVTAQVGTNIQIVKGLQLYGVVNGLRSVDEVSMVQGNLGLKADF